jgi:RNA polymerase sigma-70 factor (ECF subfamily)
MERLILKYQHRIYNTILKICANNDDASELTQDTFVKVIENIGRFQGRSSFYTWIFRIAVNLTLNHCRRRNKLQIRSLDAKTVEISESGRKLLKDYLSDEHAPDPEEVAQNRELGQIALAALNRLTEEQRAVLVLRDIEGMNYARIAVVLNVQLGTVRSRLSRARSSLKQIMEAFVNEG